LDKRGVKAGIPAKTVDLFTKMLTQRRKGAKKKRKEEFEFLFAFLCVFA
jgi:hypothetical protein